MLLKLSKRLFDRPARGYRPGFTLERALSEVGGLFVTSQKEESSARLRTVDGSLSCNVRERVDEHFLMHIVNLEFVIDVPAVAIPGVCIKIRNTGILLRTGITCVVPRRYREDLKGLRQALELDSALVAALMTLDFRHCELVGTEQGWRVRLQPIGLSEVVNRVPPFRRYIRLGAGQPDALITALSSLQRLLSPPVTT